jgi:Uncharacterized low-complexity proteins
MVDELTDRNYEYAEMKGKDFDQERFENVDFSHADLMGTNFHNCLFKNCDFSYANLKNVNFEGADLRGCDMHNADISGANMGHSMLEDANLKDIVSDDETKFFKMYCPEKGAFIGYKKCFNFRIVKLLIPADAQRTSATETSCRCDKAKVLEIEDMYTGEHYKEAVSYVDENFIYRVGQYVVADNFNPNRWVDSTGGIHYWLSRKEAEGYM